MKSILYVTILLILLSSCNTSKHLSSSSSESSVENDCKQLVAMERNKETQKEINSRNDTRITETCDTSFQTPGSDITAEKSLSDLLKYGSFAIENNAVKGAVSLDTASGKLTMTLIEKPRIFPHTFSRVTDSHQTTAIAVTENEEVKASTDSQVSSLSKSQTSSQTKEVERSAPAWIILLTILVCLFVLGLIFFLVKHFFFKPSA